MLTNRYRALQLVDPLGDVIPRWHYTLRTEEHVIPVGYCAHDCPGHATPEAAAAHYVDYLLDQCLDLHAPAAGGEEHLRCAAPGGCTLYTRHRAVLHGDHHVWPLCDQHRTRAVVEQLLVIGDAADSWLDAPSMAAVNRGVGGKDAAC